MAAKGRGSIVSLIIFSLLGGALAWTGRSVPVSASSPAAVAVSAGNNLLLTDSDGSAARIIASGSATKPLSWYSWSPDGKYLLVAQSDTRASTSRLLLYDAGGKLVRTLVDRLPWAGLYPSWARNGDEVAYIAGTCAAAHKGGCAQRSDEAVYSVDVAGKTRFLGSFTSRLGGCGGGAMDPASNLYATELDFGVTMPTLSWSIGRPLSFLGIAVPPQGSMSHVQGKVTVYAPTEVTMSPGGVVAGTVQECGKTSCDPYVAILKGTTGSVVRIVGRGEMPAWSADGRTLFFVRRTAGKTLPLRDAGGNGVQSQVYTSAIWAADAAGTHTRQLISEHAYGFGPLTVSSDGRSILFARAGNDTRLWAHRLPGNRFNAALVQSYGPIVAIQRLDLPGGIAHTIMKNAGRPALQPQPTS